MSEFIFNSPGIKFKEEFIPYNTISSGITKLGLIGTTPRGAAFQVMRVTNKDEYEKAYGSISLDKHKDGSFKYTLPYYANSFLNVGNDLSVIRVLGLSGYDAGTAWGLKIRSGVNPDTLTGTTGLSNETETFEQNNFLGNQVYSIGDSGVVFTGFTREFSGTFETNYLTTTITTYEVTAINPDGSGSVNTTTKTYRGKGYTEYDNMLVAVIRSKGYVVDSANGSSETIFTVNSAGVDHTVNQTITANSLYETFSIGVITDTTSETFNVSFNPNSSNYIEKVLDTSPEGTKTPIWVEFVHKNLIEHLDKTGISLSDATEINETSSYGSCVSNRIVEALDSDTDNTFLTDYRTSYKTPETPWVVSQLLGNKITKLFKFVLINDGDSGNNFVKISISNIDPITKTFDIYVRDFYDTDANMNILETFTNCTMIERSDNFIGNRIGTSDGEYTLKSKYFYVELGENIDPETYPAGFEGYYQPDYTTLSGSTNPVTNPMMVYKQSYGINERINRSFLGISNTMFNSSLGYSHFKFLNYRHNENNDMTKFVKTKGFHLDSNAIEIYANVGEFITGADSFSDITDVLDVNNKYYDVQTRKFTLAPYGGFDGWDSHRDFKTNTNLYKKGGIFDGVEDGMEPTTDYQAWKLAINLFSNREEMKVKLLATPNINWSDHSSLVNEFLEVIETDRMGDCFYIIDAPDIDVPRMLSENKSSDIIVSEDISDLLYNSNIDSSYGATYYTYSNYRDTVNNVNVLLPPSFDVCRAYAYNDKIKKPWFAPAGTERGALDIVSSKYKLTERAKDILYKNRINPIMYYSNVGNVIMGQKTLTTLDLPIKNINVRRLLIELKEIVYLIGNRLLFENIDEDLNNEFRKRLVPKLNDIQSERGLYGYRLITGDQINTPENIDRNELYGKLEIKPSRALEYFGFTFSVTPTAYEFSE